VTVPEGTLILSWKNWLSGPFYASFFFDRVGS